MWQKNWSLEKGLKGSVYIFFHNDKILCVSLCN